MARSAALIIRDGAIALIERRRAGRRYYLFPGGAIEEGETPEAAARREVEEELGLRVEIRRHVADVWFRGRLQHYYQAEIVGGIFGSGQGSDVLGLGPAADGTHTPVWMPLAALPGLPLYPSAVAGIALRAADDGWPASPAIVHDQGPG